MKKLFAVFTLVMALFIVNFTTNAEAVVLIPQPRSTDPPPLCWPGDPICATFYGLHQMGSFDATNIWTWNPEFVAVVNLSAIPQQFPNWQNDFMPKRTSNQVGLNPTINYREYNHQSQPNHVRVHFWQPTKGTYRVEWRAFALKECFQWDELDDFGQPWPGGPVRLSVPCHSEPNIQEVALIETGPHLMDLPGGGPLNMSDIDSVRWVEKNIFAEKYFTELGPIAQIDYDLFKRFWKNGSFQPMRELHFIFRDQKPVQGTTITLEVKLADGSVSLVKAYVASMDMSDLPKVDGTISALTYTEVKEKKSGKVVIKAEETTVNNINLREIDDPSGGKALVIQWPEPDIALFGGADMGAGSNYYLKVWVGIPLSVGRDPATLNYQDCFIWMDVPPQMGTVVVEAPLYEALLIEGAKFNYTKADFKVALFYGKKFNPPAVPSDPTVTWANWQIRGGSDPVPLP